MVELVFNAFVHVKKFYGVHFTLKTVHLKHYLNQDKITI